MHLTTYIYVDGAERVDISVQPHVAGPGTTGTVHLSSPDGSVQIFADAELRAKLLAKLLADEQTVRALDAEAPTALITAVDMLGADIIARTTPPEDRGPIGETPHGFTVGTNVPAGHPWPPGNGAGPLQPETPRGQQS